MGIIKDHFRTIIWLFCVVIFFWVGELVTSVVFPNLKDGILYTLIWGGFSVLTMGIFVNIYWYYTDPIKRGGKNWRKKENRQKKNSRRLNDGKITQEEYEKKRLEILSDYRNNI